MSEEGPFGVDACDAPVCKPTVFGAITFELTTLGAEISRSRTIRYSTPSVHFPHTVLPPSLVPDALNSGRDPMNCARVLLFAMTSVPVSEANLVWIASSDAVLCCGVSIGPLVGCGVGVPPPLVG